MCPVSERVWWSCPSSIGFRSRVRPGSPLNTALAPSPHAFPKGRGLTSVLRPGRLQQKGSRMLLFGRTARRRSDRPTLPRARPALEELESRIVPYAATGNLWPHPELVTLSFVPDWTL